MHSVTGGAGLWGNKHSYPPRAVLYILSQNVFYTGPDSLHTRRRCN